MSPMNEIQRTTFIRAPRSRVWRALTDITEFCRWFCAETAERAFRPGAHIKMASTYPGPYYKKEFSLHVEEMVPEQTFSWRWHPGVTLQGEDVTGEPMTLVTFRLEDAEGGTIVTLTETGFDQLFASRQAHIFEQNDGGWKAQLAALERYFSESV